MHWRRQGDLGEVSALEWLVAQGWDVYVPFGHSEHCDLVAGHDGRLIRVQVKTSMCFLNDRWQLTLCTRGGNQSWNGLVKRFSADHCDWLYVHVGDGRRWFMPAAVVEGGRGILLGGPKYAAYEIEAGRPLPMAVSA
jgi:Holliday junction resolvase-like predicted endonuclease